MKKIIEGKIYNTETAILLGEYSNGLSHSDARFLEEAVYVTKKGAYFLYGAGGVMTKYMERAGNTSWGTSTITVLTKEEAYKWLEKHNKWQVIEERFSSYIEEA